MLLECFQFWMARMFHELTLKENVKPVSHLLPEIVVASQYAGRISKGASQRFFGLKEGIPVAAPEDDQPSALETRSYIL
jgi:sugar (pentulose or hexulose) kinase